MDADDDYERILSVKNEVFVYKIPPRQSSRAYRAADWKLDQPEFTGRLRIVALNNKCFLKLEDKKGELFAQAPIDQYPGASVESVADSSRYFVIKVVDDDGRHAFIGIGFADRGDSFDFNVTLQDHFKREKLEGEITQGDAKTPLNLGFKEGETIKINIGNKAGQEAKARLKKTSGGNLGLLPPPPSGAPTPSSGRTHQRTNSGGITQQSQPIPQDKQPDADWGDFATFTDNSSTEEAAGWVQF